MFIFMAPQESVVRLLSNLRCREAPNLFSNEPPQIADPCLECTFGFTELRDLAKILKLTRTTKQNKQNSER